MYTYLDAVWRYFGELFSGLSLKLCLVALAGLFSSVFDMSSPSRESLVYLLCIDYVLGIAHAFKDDRFVLRRACSGVVGKFVGCGLIIIICRLADRGIGIPLSVMGGNYTLTEAFCGLICINETLSALTHLDAFGVPIPAVIMSQLRRYRRNIAGPEKKEAEHLVKGGKA